MLNKFILILSLGTFVYAAEKDPIVDLKMIIQKKDNSKDNITKFIKNHNFICETPDKKYKLPDTANMCRTSDSSKYPYLFVGIEEGVVVLASDSENVFSSGISSDDTMDIGISDQFDCMYPGEFRNTCFNKKIKGVSSKQWWEYLSKRFPLNDK